MLQVFVALQSFISDMPDRFNRENGATAVEYGLMVALIAIVIITAVALVGTNLKTVFSTVAGKLTTVAN